MSVPRHRPTPPPVDTGPADAAVPPVSPAGPMSPPRRLRSQDLLAGNSEVEIDHAGATYRLRLTALGKLILTK